MVRTMKSVFMLVSKSRDRKRRERTEDEFLSGCKHVQGECHFVLVVFQSQPSQKGREDRGRGWGGHG